ncbi:hypothetical protein R3P38DRAFT_3343842 [Favolaschia claudopus]|uniref:Uncharacterized protein n=1 Tax=Favolaschia claudopus TaxID=2862362 RepID=A0AAW0DFM3_9AGAR
MNYVVDAGNFESRWQTMLFTVAVNSTVLVLYALYVILFIYSITTLTRRKQAQGGLFLVGTAYTMFLLATIGLIIVLTTTWLALHTVYSLVQGSTARAASSLDMYHALALGQDIILALNNLVTDLLFLYRCFVIWGARRRVLVVILPIAMILATVVVGCISVLGYYKMGLSIDIRIPFIMGAATNILLVSLTAGRIWYIRREARALTGRSLGTRYGTVVAVLMESGMLYSLCVVIYVVSISINKFTIFGTIFNGVAWGLVQVGVNIVPTLILVRVAMGRSTENKTADLSFDSVSTSQPIFVTIQSSFTTTESGRETPSSRRETPEQRIKNEQDVLDIH